MKLKAVVDSGPIIHLRELELIHLLDLFETYTGPAVLQELKSIPKSIKIITDKTDSNKVQILVNEFELGLGESEAIRLAVERQIPLFLTDDLDARTAARVLGLEVHGTIGIILKGFRSKMLTKKQTLETIDSLKQKSSLYITEDLIQFVRRKVEQSN